MPKKLSYNQMHLVSLISGTVFVLLSVTAMLLYKENEPTPLIIMKLLAQFITLITMLFVSWEQRSTPSYADEMAIDHNKRASELTLRLILLIIVTLSLVTQINKLEITISSDLLICIVFAVYAIHDAYYLYLEKEGAKDADIDNKD